MREAYTQALPFIETTSTEGVTAISAAKELVGDMKAMLVGWLTSLGLPKEEAALVGPENAVALTEKALAAQERGMQARAAELMSEVAGALDSGKREVPEIPQQARTSAPPPAVT